MQDGLVLQQRLLNLLDTAKILFKGNCATGVQLQNGKVIDCNKEVILCAGALETPRLLQLSGIGNKELLAQHGIDCISNLPGVGENYQDHLLINVPAEVHQPISFYGENKGLKAVKNLLQYILTKTGIMSSTVLESGGFFNISKDPFGADIQFHVLPYLLDGVNNSQSNKSHGISVTVCILRPKSRGSIKIKSADASIPAIFYAGSLQHDDDVKILVKGVKKVLDIYKQPSFSKHIKKILSPLKTDDKSLNNFVRECAETVYHPSGTCKMGIKSDPMAVVDHNLKVYGIENIRVCDVSIMPTIISGNTNAPAMMIGERCARFILDKSKTTR